MKGVVIIIFIILSLTLMTVCQQSRRGSRRGQSQGETGSIVDSISYTLFPGSSTTPLITRVFNKISYYAAGIVVAIISYFTFFRKNKKRNETIGVFLGDWQTKMTVHSQNYDKEKVDKMMYELNFKTGLKITMKSFNERVSQNIELKVIESEQDSKNLYKIKIEGADPEGKSVLEGYACLAWNKLEIALAQTHSKYQKKQESPIHYFEGKQINEIQPVIEGEWWIEGQKGTTGQYTGTWRFQY